MDMQVQSKFLELAGITEIVSAGAALRKRLFSICGRAEFWRVQVRRNSVMYGREKLALAIGRRWSLEIETSGISLKPI
jgi:hypothetical protein